MFVGIEVVRSGASDRRVTPAIARMLLLSEPPPCSSCMSQPLSCDALSWWRAGEFGRQTMDKAGLRKRLLELELEKAEREQKAQKLELQKAQKTKQPSAILAPACRFFRSGSCAKGKDCPFSHLVRGKDCRFSHVPPSVTHTSATPLCSEVLLSDFVRLYVCHTGLEPRTADARQVHYSHVRSSLWTGELAAGSRSGSHLSGGGGDLGYGEARPARGGGSRRGSHHRQGGQDLARNMREYGLRNLRLRSRRGAAGHGAALAAGLARWSADGGLQREQGRQQCHRALDRPGRRERCAGLVERPRPA